MIEHDAHFEVTDADGISLAVVYFDNEPSLQSMKRQSKDEARLLAREIARLPTLQA